MTKRILDANASDFDRMDGDALAESIRLAEGRTLAAEVIATYQPLVEGVSNGEIAAAMGADIIVLDRYDPISPVLQGVPRPVLESDVPLTAYKRLLGRPVGINMIAAHKDVEEALGGRFTSAANFAHAAEQGADVIFVYHRLMQGGTREKLLDAVKTAHKELGKSVLLIGVQTFKLPPPRIWIETDIWANWNRRLIEAGCHAVALPMPGSAQGWTLENEKTLIDDAHQAGGLVWLLVTGSVEGAPADVMHRLALEGKILGADAYRLDEAGLGGLPKPANITAFSLALRGERHTYRRMAASPLR